MIATTQSGKRRRTVPERADRNLDVAEATLTGALGRCDNKASLLLALTGAALAIVISSAPKWHLSTGALTIALLGVGAWISALVALLLTVRPHLDNDDRASWPYWSRLSPAEIQGEITEDRRADRIKVLAVMVRWKFTCIRWAVDLMLAGIALLIAAAVIAVVQ